MEQYIYLILAIMLIIYSIQDIKRKKINLLLLIIVIPILLVCLYIEDKLRINSYLFGLILGIGLYIFSILSRGQFGRGDAVIIGIIGLGTGFWNSLIIFFYGLLLAAVYSAILLVKNGFKRNIKIPFVPFLFLGYLCFIISY